MSTMTATAPLASVSELEFVAPIPGFAGEDRFRLASLERTGVLWALESARTEGLRFIVAVPEPFFPNYSPVVDADVIAPLLEDAGSLDASALQLLVILTVAGPIATATANLLAPLIVAPATGRVMQVVLGDDTLSLRAPLSAATAG
jgi:flagellar assembly factor FliW